MGAELIGSFHGTTHGLIQIFFLSHLNIALLFTFCQNNPSMPATRQNIDFYIRFSSLFCKWSCLQQILSAYQIHILKRDDFLNSSKVSELFKICSGGKQNWSNNFVCSFILKDNKNEMFYYCIKQKIVNIAFKHHV